MELCLPCLLPNPQTPPPPGVVGEAAPHKWLCNSKGQNGRSFLILAWGQKAECGLVCSGLGKMELVGTEREDWQPRGEAGMYIGGEHMEGPHDPHPYRKEGIPLVPF